MTTDREAAFTKRLQAVYRSVFVDYWPYSVAAACAAVLNVMLLAYWGTAWGITGELTRWGGHVLRWFGAGVEDWSYFAYIGMDGTPFTRSSGGLTLGMFAGALVAALLSGSFRIRMPQQKIRLVQGFAGGVIAGLGARMAMGCNLGSFFSAIPQFSLHGWLFMLGLFPGTYLGAKLALLPLFRGRPGGSRASGRGAAASRGGGRSSRPGEPNSRPKVRQEAVGLLAAGLLISVLVVALRANTEYGVLLLFGIGFGFIIQRGRICFTAAFRELWITRQGELGRALAVAMAISTLGFATLIHNGIGGGAQFAGPGALIGGILFGIGIVLTGGCESGWIYRSAEGYVQLWFAGLGTITGATALAWAWDSLGLFHYLVEGWPALTLIDVWGWPAAILGTLALLGGWYFLLTWWETQPVRFQTTTARAVQPVSTASTDASA